jgi:hypothetical protein
MKNKINLGCLLMAMTQIPVAHACAPWGFGPPEAPTVAPCYLPHAVAAPSCPRHAVALCSSNDGKYQVRIEKGNLNDPSELEAKIYDQSDQEEVIKTYYIRENTDIGIACRNCTMQYLEKYGESQTNLHKFEATFYGINSTSFGRGPATFFATLDEGQKIQGTCQRP